MIQQLVMYEEELQQINSDLRDPPSRLEREGRLVIDKNGQPIAQAATSSSSTSRRSRR